MSHFSEHGTSEHWQAVYRSPALVSRRQRSHRRKLARLGVLEWPRSFKILDLCCGSGEALCILHQEGFTELWGADIKIDSDLRSLPWCRTVQCQAQRLPLENSSFDGVLIMHSLHHLGVVTGIRATLSEARRVLRPGGRLALVDHHNAPQVWWAFWALRQPWLTWWSPALKSFCEQHREEWPYLSQYLRQYRNVRRLITELGFKTIVDCCGAFFFYWTGEHQ